MDIVHKAYKLQLDFDITKGADTKTGSLEIPLEPTYKSYKGSNLLDAMMSV